MSLECMVGVGSLCRCLILRNLPYLVSCKDTHLFVAYVELGVEWILCGYVM